MAELTSEVTKLVQEHGAFLDHLIRWFDALPNASLSELTDSGRHPERVAVLSEDMVKGFTSVGRLASPRIAAIIPGIVRVLEVAYELGVRDFVLPHDSHPADSPQFAAYGPHCVTGTVEAETIDEITALPFSDQLTIISKASLNPAIGTNLNEWFDERPAIESVVVVGNCTDLCVYQAAMHLKIRSNAIKRPMSVIVPEDCVQTYDLGVEDARAIGGTPHDAELMHLVFLYHMHLNDISVVRHID